MECLSCLLQEDTGYNPELLYMITFPLLTVLGFCGVENDLYLMNPANFVVTERDSIFEEVSLLQINTATVLQICVLLSALPIQYFISQWYGTDSVQRLQVTQRTVSQYASAPGDSNKCYYVLNLFERIIGYWNSFIKSYLSLDAWTDHLKLWISKTRNWYYGEKRTLGVEDEEEIHAYFAESTHIHSPKPESVQFNVGQVIVHRRFGYSGVIVGWDVKARVPEEWLQHKYPPDKQIRNPDLTTYFSRYDGSKYIMQLWLRKIYPHD